MSKVYPMGSAFSPVPWILLCSCLPSVPLAAGDDVVTLKDGSTQSGIVIELGGNRVELEVKSSSRKILKREIRKVQFDEARAREQTETTDAVVRNSGHIVRGKVEVLEGGLKVQVTIPGGGKAVFLKEDVRRILRRGDKIQLDTTVYTSEVAQAIQKAVDQLVGSAGGEQAVGENERFLAACGILAIELVRTAMPGATKASEGARALARVERLHRLKESTATEIEEAEPKVYEILSSGSLAEKLHLLSFVFPRFVEESVPLAVFLAGDDVEDPTVRAWSVDFLRRMQRNRELVEIHKSSSGQAQLACAIALGKNRILAGIPTLIGALEVDSMEVRELASRHLQELTERDFQFRADGAPQARKEAIARWRAWWQENEKDLLHSAQNVLHGSGEQEESSPERRAAVMLWKEASIDVEKGRYTQAEALLRQALERDPTFFQGSLALGVLLYSHLRKTADGVRLLSELKLKRIPGVTREDRQWIYMHLGHASFLAGDLPGAEAAYTEAKSINHENLQALLGLGDVCSRLAVGEGLNPEARKEKLSTAVGVTQAAISLIDKLNGDLVAIRPESLPLAGEAPFDRRAFNRSVLELRKRYRSQKRELSFRLAKLLALTGERKGAMITLRGTIEDLALDGAGEAKGLEADMRCYLGLLYEEMGQSLLALREFRKVLKDVDAKHAESLRGVERLRRQAEGKSGN